MKKRLLLLFIAFIVFIFSSCSPETDRLSSQNEDGLLCVHYIDVGQGDSIFIEMPNDETMLIDAGVSSFEETIENYIKKLGYDSITYLIATHPHADHIGGMAHIVNSFDIGSVYMPGAATDTRTFENLLETIQEKGLKIKTAKAGISIIDSRDLSVQFVAPAEDFDDLNNASAVIMLKYKDNSFLFTGDAEAEAEKTISSDVNADVLKVGHHGSDTSTSDEFLARVSPKYAVISCGEGNSYGHPHSETLKKLDKAGVLVLRTDINGNITFTSDGTEIDFYSDYK